MAMTRDEYIAKEQVQNILAKEGYPTYASLLSNFDLHLTNDPGVIGYMDISKAAITLNRGLDIEQVSVIVRHEILHEYLSHALRMEQHLGKDKWDKRTSKMHNDSNIAGDYEISNRGYTEKDKEAVRRIKLNGKELQGLVTEDQHPEWIDMSIEEMYDELQKERKEDQKEKPEPSIGDKGDEQIQQAEEMERQANAVSNDAGQMIDDLEQDSQQSGNGGEEDSEEQDGEGQASGAGADSGEEGEESQSSDGEGQGEESDGEGSESDSEGTPSDSSSGSPSGSTSKAQQQAQSAKAKADAAAEAADDLADAIEKAKDEFDDSGKIFQDEKDKEIEDAIQERLRKIKELLNDAATQERAVEESTAAVEKSRAIKAAKDAAKYKETPLAKFVDSLNGFIKKEVATGRGTSWSRINKKYAHSSIIKPGTTRNANNKVPVINVYFDRSGSWDDAKTAVGKQAIGTLNKYVQRGQIKINLYYFANEVSSVDPHGGGTYGQPILDHIKATKPDNVIIMTDSDIDDCKTPTTVPGAVWFLFKGGVSENLKQNLKGLRLTKSFELD